MRKFVFEIPGLFPDFVVCLIAVKTAGPSSDMQDCVVGYVRVKVLPSEELAPY